MANPKPVTSVDMAYLVEKWSVPFHYGSLGLCVGEVLKNDVFISIFWYILTAIKRLVLASIRGRVPNNLSSALCKSNEWPWTGSKCGEPPKLPVAALQRSVKNNACDMTYFVSTGPWNRKGRLHRFDSSWIRNCTTCSTTNQRQIAPTKFDPNSVYSMTNTTITDPRKYDPDEHRFRVRPKNGLKT